MDFIVQDLPGGLKVHRQDGLVEIIHLISVFTA
jgi:hypothetical protein